MGLSELYLSPGVLTSRIHGLPRESEKSRKCCFQTPSLKIRSSFSSLRASQASDNMVGSGQDFRSKVAMPLKISSRRGTRCKCVPKGSDAKEFPFTPDTKLVPAFLRLRAFFLGLLRAGQVQENLVDDYSSLHTEVIRMYDDEGNEVSVVTGESNDNTKMPMPMPMPTLELYGTNLTKLAEQGKLYLAGKIDVAERQDLVDLVAQILCFETQNNPALIGGFRVGKTSIVEGLAQRIASGDVPDEMKGKKVIKLDMSLLLAGTKHRGELEERLKKLIAEVKRSDEIILFIDEVHFLSGAGASEGALAAANILRSAIARGELKWCIGAMTFDEYRNHFHEDPLLERRFMPVPVPEPSLDDTIEILKGLQVQQENRHEVGYTMEALFSAAQLYYRHLTDCFIPDELIFSIDQADSHVCVRNPQLLEEAKEEAREVLKELWQITNSKNEAVCIQYIKEDRRELGLWLDIAIICTKAKMGLDWPDVEAIVTSWTGIPIHKYSLKLMIIFLEMKRLFSRKENQQENEKMILEQVDQEEVMLVLAYRLNKYIHLDINQEDLYQSKSKAFKNQMPIIMLIWFIFS